MTIRHYGVFLKELVGSATSARINFSLKPMAGAVTLVAGMLNMGIHALGEVLRITEI